MAASNTNKAIGTMQNKSKTKQNCKETKEFLPLSFDRFIIFIYSNIITSKTVPCCGARILRVN